MESGGIMTEGKRANSRTRYSTVLVPFVMLIVTILMLQAAPCTNAAVTDAKIESGSILHLDDDGAIERFTIWIEFPVPVDTDDANDSISLFVPGKDDWYIGNRDFPYDIEWSDDRTRIEIDSGKKDLAGDNVYSITVTISTPLRTEEGDLFWEDRSQIDLVFGNPNDLDLGYGPVEILLFFFLPFIILVPLLILIEVLLRSTIKTRKKKRVDSSSETLLRLIDRSEGWLRRRMILTMVLTFLVIFVYISIVLVALLNAMFAMVLTWIVVLFLTPWAILVVSAVLFTVFRRESLAWKKGLKDLRKQQDDFIKGLEKE
jgi:hypothetical protein